MKIISKFKDYYDYMAYLGVDNKVVYERHTASSAEMVRVNKRPNSWFPGPDRWEHFDHWLIICNKAYRLPLWVTDFTKDVKDHFKKEYTLISVEQYIERENKGLDERYRGKWFRRNKPRYMDMSDFEPRDVKCKYPIVANMSYSKDDNLFIHPERWGEHIIINPRLIDYGFASRIPAEQVWQELSMFIASTEVKMLEITDEIRAQQKGFDKTSFRKDTHQSKPRGRK